MTRQENIKLIREACIEANPAIMELKPGCYVRDFFKGTSIVMAIEKDAAGKDCYDIFLTEGDPELIWQQPRGDLEVLCRSIRLTDILVAIQSRNLKQMFFIDQEGGFGTVMPGEPPKLVSVFKGWNLYADSLDEQSDEALTFLAELLSGAARSYYNISG
jgi:hypothetical protein